MKQQSPNDFNIAKTDRGKLTVEQVESLKIITVLVNKLVSNESTDTYYGVQLRLCQEMDEAIDYIKGLKN